MRTLSPALCRVITPWLRLGTFAALLAAPNLFPAPIAQAQGAVPAPSGGLPPVIDGGPYLATHVGVETTFDGVATAPDGAGLVYRWDFDGDGRVDWQRPLTGRAAHRYERAGRYLAVLTVADAAGKELARSTVKVLVRPGPGAASRVPRPSRLEGVTGDAASERRRSVRGALALSDDEARFLELLPEESGLPSAGAAQPLQLLAAQGLPPDGVRHRYVVMLNASSEPRFWEDVTITYGVFTGTYGIPAADIFLLNYDGLSVNGDNPGGMIRGPASKASLRALLTTLSGIVDGDDLVLLWVTGHGYGYIGPREPTFGYLSSVASVDPGDEQDYLEKDFKLRALFQSGTRSHRMHLGELGLVEIPSQGVYYRHRFVSHFDNLFFSVPNATLSDHDIRIEEVVDYLAGDKNRDGIITADEVMDYDGDGRPPYDSATDTYDEDDWGPLDELRDDIRTGDTVVPTQYLSTFSILDVGLDDKLDVDLDYAPAHPEADGTDVDGDGFFDGLDVDRDGDKADWVSIDESLAMPDNDHVLDDDLAEMLAGVHPETLVVILEPCFSGGFAWDLRGPGRVIISATEQDDYSWGNSFIRNVAAALAGTPVIGSSGDPTLADANGDGRVDMVELFSFAAANDLYTEVPQYEDDGDGISHAYPLTGGSDGALGAMTSLGERLAPLPDLAMSGLSGPPSLMRGEIFFLRDGVVNRGEADAGPFAICYYVSTDPLITTADVPVGGRRVSGLAAKGSDSAEASFALPLSIGPGSYFWGAIADCDRVVPEADETNNAVVGTAFVVVGASDLAAQAVSGPTKVAAGGAASVLDAFRNDGPDDQPRDVVVSIYLSTDDAITRSDTLVGTRRVSGGVAAGAVSSQTQSYTVPASLAPGRYWWGAIVTGVVEYGDLGTDPDESNNTVRGGQVDVVTGGLEATVVVRPGDWGSGFCADLRVTNRSTRPTTGWKVKLNTNGTVIYSKWNGAFSGNSGIVTVTPTGGSWNSVIAPGATNSFVGFCASRPVPGSRAVPIVVEATGTY